MLTIEECRKYLDAETNSALDDAALRTVLDDLYALARLLLDSEKKNEHE
jgi:hypothetical protein